jgi:muramoyltetrapeptide carboxypeptidase
MASFHTWLPLAAGDVVDVVAPGFRSTDAELSSGGNFLRGWGLKPRIPKRFYGRDVLCANSDEVRFEHLKTALYAGDSRAIWCIRGGYGSNRLMPALMRLKRPRGRPKLVIGLSDITSLHVFLNQEWGWPTVHGPLLDRLGRKAALPKYERELKRFIFGHEPEVVFSGLKPMNLAARTGSAIHAEVSGGNLVVLQSSLATDHQWQSDGKILFFEEIGERGYRVDRILEQFTQASLFKRARAVVFGQFIGGREPDGTNHLWPVIERFAKESRLPVLKGLASGHDVIQRPLPLGTRSTLYLGGSKARLVCASGGKA